MRCAKHSTFVRYRICYILAVHSRFISQCFVLTEQIWNQIVDHEEVAGLGWPGKDRTKNHLIRGENNIRSARVTIYLDMITHAEQFDRALFFIVNNLC